MVMDIFARHSLHLVKLQNNFLTLLIMPKITSKTDLKRLGIDYTHAQSLDDMDTLDGSKEIIADLIDI
jgi:hypothetical protein